MGESNEKYTIMEYLLIGQWKTFEIGVLLVDFCHQCERAVEDFRGSSIDSFPVKGEYVDGAVSHLFVALFQELPA